MKKVFIDTNIYLNFYRKKGHPTKELSTLKKAIKEKKIDLIVTKQLYDEFYRNVNDETYKIINELENYKKNLDFDLSTPELVKVEGIKRQINNYRKSITNSIDKLISRYKNKVENPNSRINTYINNIFSQVTDEIHKEILDKAYYRTLRGNPPRKGNNSFGDAINWEILLQNYTDYEMIIISDDGDFESNNTKGRLSEFLEIEWEDKSSHEIKLFKTLGEFLNKLYAKKIIDEKEIKEDEARLLYQVPFTTGIVEKQTDQSIPILYAPYIDSSKKNWVTVPGSNAEMFNRLRIIPQDDFLIRCNKCGIILDKITGDGLCDQCRESKS